MAMQTGMGFSRIIFLVGAGTKVLTAELEMQLNCIIEILHAASLVKGYEKKGEDGELDVYDAMANQVCWLAMEVRQLASTQQITVLNGDSGGKVTSIIVPAAAVSFGLRIYVVEDSEGLSFSDLMYVTKKSMANAVLNLSKHLEHVSDALAATKKHLTQRIENLDGKLDDQVEISKLIKNEVTDVHGELSDIGHDLDTIHDMVSGLNGKILTLEGKQDLANHGILYLVNFVNGKEASSPQMLQVQEQLKLSGKTQGLLTSSEAPSLKGLKDIADSLLLEDVTRCIVDGNVEKLADQPRRLMRRASAKC